MGEEHDIIMPVLNVDNKHMQEIEDWEVGKKYKMVIEVEMKSKSMNREMVSGGFDILAYKYLKDKTMDEMSDDEFGEYQDEQLAKHK